MKKPVKGTANQQRALTVFVKLLRCAESLSHRVHAHLSDFNLSLSQFQVLEVLYHVGPLCQRDIASKILKSTGNLTMIIDNLEKQKLVRREKDANDRRYYSISLTKQGQKLIEKVFPQHVEILENEMGVLTAKEQEQLGKLTKKLGLGKK